MTNYYPYDDSKIFIHGKYLDQMVTSMSNKLSKFNDWINTNKLFFNTSKTFYMIFTPKKQNVVLNNSISIQNIPLNSVNSIKCLGFV